MPIPHIKLTADKKKISNNNLNDDIIFLWLPGPIRKDKGIKNIKAILKNIKDTRPCIKILINEKSKNEFKNALMLLILFSVSLITKSNMLRRPFDNFLRSSGGQCLVRTNTETQT